VTKLEKKTDSISKSRSILERGPAVMYHCEEFWDVGIDYITPNVSELLGWSAEDFLNDSVFRMELVHPDDLADLLEVLKTLFSTEKQKHEYRIRTKDGSYIWVQDDIRVLQNTDGNYDGIVGCLTDVTDLKAAETSLRESELRHRAIFETVLEGIIMINTSGIVQDMNKAAEDIFGYPSQKVIGQNVSMLMPEPFSSRHDEFIANFLTTGEARVIGLRRSVQGLRSSGDVFDMHLSVAEVDLPDGRYFVGAVHDISKRVKAELALRNSQERLRMSQQFAKLGTWDWHIEKDELYWSSQVFRLYGIPNDGNELRHERFRDWVLPEDYELVQQAILQCMKQGEAYKCEYRIRLPNDTIRWLRDQGNVVRNREGHAVRMLGVTQDISVEKKSEEALRRAREEADNANQAKSHFLSSMSHELRTPLNAILGFAQLLSMSGKYPLADRQAKQVGQIVQAGNHLMELINEVLDLARIEAGRLKLAFELVDIDDLLEECLDLSEALAAEKQINVTADTSLIEAVWADKMRLKQVLLNLLSNAIKYNDNNGNVRLEVKRFDDDQVHFIVSDDGYGIALEKQSQIFKPFDRLGAEASKIEGTGIGLTLTKQLVEAMGGTLGFVSVLGEGSSFDVLMPIGAPAQSDEVLDESLMIKRKVFIVDPSNECKENLKRFNHLMNDLDLFFIGETDEYIQEIERNNPDLVLLDIEAFENSNKKVVETLRQLLNMKEVPLFALLPVPTELGGEDLDLDGFDDCLVKPINLRELREKLIALWIKKNE